MWFVNVCDCVAQYLDRQKPPLSTKRVKPYVLSAAAFVFEKYHPLRRSEFENGKTYFAEMLQEYVEVQRREEEEKR